MIIPMYYFLIPYGVFLLTAGIFVIFNVMHLLAFGMQGFKTAFVVLLYLGSSAAVIAYSYILIIQYDWAQDFLFDDIVGSVMNPIL